MNRSLHLILSISLLMAHTCYATAPSTGTTNFNSLAQTNLTGGSVATPATVTNAGTLGWDFTVNTDGGMVSLTSAGAGVSGAADVCIRFNRSTANFFITSSDIRSNDASAFKLNHVYLKVNLFTGTTADMTLTGYRNGVAVSGATKTITGITNNPTWTIFDVSGISAFNKVTEFRFTQAATSSAEISFTAIDEIDIAAPIPLPLTLDVFSGQWQDNTVTLSWTTLQEQNTAWFEIQRTIDATDYQSVGKIPAAGNSEVPFHYEFIDNLLVLASPKYYYRLKMIDLDGRFTYSPIISIAIPAGAFHLTAYPNPLVSTTTLTATSNAQADGLLTVTDIYGRKILVRSVHLQQGTNKLSLPFFGAFEKGIYQLRLATHEKTGTIRLLKTD
jgi:hypothetical protein